MVRGGAACSAMAPVRERRRRSKEEEVEEEVKDRR
jgi:hypothetical protein